MASVGIIVLILSPYNLSSINHFRVTNIQQLVGEKWRFNLQIPYLWRVTYTQRLTRKRSISWRKFEKGKKGVNVLRAYEGAKKMKCSRQGGKKL